MSADYLRYSCQMALPGFDKTKQDRLGLAKVLMVGIGGLGCPAAQYLVAAGIGTLGIADGDIISISNLHRQVLFTPAEAGMLKAEVACNKLRLQNPDVKLINYPFRINADNVMEMVNSYDLVVDCTDNFETRYLLNDACVLAGKALVYGGIYQYEGQCAVWNVLNEDGSRSPHYRDIFPDVDASQVPDCAEGGVLPTLAGIIGCMQANEVLKLITGTGETLAGRLVTFNVQSMESHVIKIGKRSAFKVEGLPQRVSVPIVSVDELKEMLVRGGCTLLDVRNADERLVFNIGGIHIPLAELDQHQDAVFEEKPLVIYCASGKRSAEAVKIFKQKRPRLTVFSLEGGMKSWIEKS